MKPNTQVMDRAGDLGGEKIAMQIDAAATAHIMQVLTDLYSDPVLAVIREYSTNALDAHIMAGVTRPIEVTTPNQLSPIFTVTDFGVGLDKDDIREIYSQYGASTKRSSDLVNGILGLGCKSALTYTNQFTVTSVKDGIKTIVAVSRVEDGTGQMEVVSEKATSEGNGTTIAVPVGRIGWKNEFKEKSTLFFRFWKKGTILLDGQDPTGLGSEVKEVSSNIFMVPGLEQDYIVMGNVAYPCDQALYAGARHRNDFGVVAFVSMGAVNFTPSREKLFMSPTTKAEIGRVQKDFQAGLHKVMRDDIENAPSHADALKRYRTWANTTGLVIQVTYNGQAIPQVFKPVLSVKTVVQNTSQYGYVDKTPVVWLYDRSSYRYAVKDKREVNDNVIGSAVIITDFKPGDTITPRHREKMKDWAEQNGHSGVNYFIATADSTFGSPWVERPTLTWDALKAHKLPKNPNAPAARAKRKAKYDIVKPDGSIEQSDNITTKDIIYVSPSDDVLKSRQYGRYVNNTPEARRDLTTAFPNATLVVIAVNRFAKFQRDYPNAVKVAAYAKGHLADTFNVLSPDEKAWLGTDYSARNSVSLLDSNRVDDPVIKEFIRVSALKETKAIQAYQKAKELAKVKFYFSLPEADKIPNPLNGYPLFTSPSYGDNRKVWAEHTYIYLNAVYAAKKAVKNP